MKFDQSQLPWPQETITVATKILRIICTLNSLHQVNFTNGRVTILSDQLTWMSNFSSFLYKKKKKESVKNIIRKSYSLLF